VKFRSKTILGIALIEATMLAILIVTALSVLRATNESELERRAKLGCNLIASAAKDAVIAEDLATLENLVAEAMSSDQIDYVSIVNARGMVLAERATPAKQFQQDRSIGEVSDNFFDWASPIVAGKSRYGEVRIGVSTKPLNSLMMKSQRWAAGVALVEMLLVATISWLLSNYLLRQLDSLREASVKFGSGDFDHHVPVKGSDELSEVAIAFNQMAVKLKSGLDALRSESASRFEAKQQLELALMEIKQWSDQLSAVFLLTPDGFVSFDAERKVKLTSPAFNKLFNLRGTDLIGLGEKAFWDWFEKRCTPESRFSGAPLLLHKSKGERHLTELAGPIKSVIELQLEASNSTNVSQVLHVRDVTRETEVDRIKNEFLATAAHELRTPIVSILEFSELLLTRAYLPQQQHEFLEIIHDQSKWMASILNHLLDLARIDAQRGKYLHLATTDIGVLLHKAVAEFSSSEGGRIVIHLPSESRHAIVDQANLSKAVSDLLSNGLKYSAAGDAVECRLLDAVIKVNEKECFGIRIRDYGIGMTKEQLAQVGDRFYRVDSSGKNPGTGLGVSFVKEIIALHHGKFEIDSEIGKGTTVTLWLPLLQVPSGLQ